MDALESPQLGFFPVVAPPNPPPGDTSAVVPVAGEFAQALAQAPGVAAGDDVAVATTTALVVSSVIEEAAPDASADWTGMIPWAPAPLLPAEATDEAVPVEPTTGSGSVVLVAADSADTDPATPPLAPAVFTAVMTQNVDSQPRSIDFTSSPLAHDVPAQATAALPPSNALSSTLMVALAPVTAPQPPPSSAVDAVAALSVKPASDQPEKGDAESIGTTAPSFVVHTLPTVMMDPRPGSVQSVAKTSAGGPHVRPSTTESLSPDLLPGTPAMVADNINLPPMPTPPPVTPAPVAITVQTTPVASSPVEASLPSTRVPNKLPSVPAFVTPPIVQPAVPPTESDASSSDPVSAIVPAVADASVGTTSPANLKLTPSPRHRIATAAVAATSIGQPRSPDATESVGQPSPPLTPVPLAPITDRVPLTAVPTVSARKPIADPEPMPVQPGPDGDDSSPRQRDSAAAVITPLLSTTAPAVPVLPENDANVPAPPVPAISAATVAAVRSAVDGDATTPVLSNGQARPRTVAAITQPQAAAPVALRGDDAAPTVGLSIPKSEPASTPSVTDASVQPSRETAPVFDTSLTTEQPARSEPVMPPQRIEVAHGHAPALDFGDPVPIHHAEQLVQRLGDAISFARDSGQELSIRVAPPQFGPIVIEVRLQDGTMSARVETHSAIAHEMITDHLPQLHESLASRGANLDRIDVVPVENRSSNERFSPGERALSEREASTSGWGSAGTSERQGADAQDQQRRRAPRPQAVPVVENSPAAVPANGSRLMELQGLNVRV